MPRFTQALVALCFASILLSGCAIKQNCLTHSTEIQPGWVTINGPAVPATTTSVDSTGKSLVNCLLDCRIIEILEHRRDVRSAASGAFGDRPISEVDTRALLKVLQEVEKSSTPALMYTALLQEVESLQLSFPQLLAGAGSVSLAYAFDPTLSTVQDRTRLERQINFIEDHAQRQAAQRAYFALMSSTGPVANGQESLELLNSYAQNGILNIEESQRARTWSYTTIKAFQTSTISGGSSRSEPGTAGAPVEPTSQVIVGNLLNGVSSNPQAGLVTSGYATQDSDPLDTLFAIVESQKSRVVIVPLDAVFDSPLGGLWLFPGDRVSLIHLREMGFLDGQLGDKRVGLTGLTSQRGIVETNASKLKPLLYQVDHLVDIRSNLVVVSYPVGSSSVKLLMPYSPTPSRAGSSMNRLAQLQNYIGLSNGAVVTLDHTDVSPLLKRSRRLMQDAAAAQSAVPQHRLCAHDKTGAAPATRRDGVASTENLPDVPIVSDACEYLQQTGKDTWKLAENWWEAAVP